MPRNTLLAALATILIGGVFYWFVGQATLALSAGGVWGIGLLVTLRIRDRYPSYTTWRRKRDIGLTALVPVILGLAATHVYFSIDAAIASRLGVAFVVAGVGYTGYVAGMLDVLNRRDTNESADESVTETLTD